MSLNLFLAAKREDSLSESKWYFLKRAIVKELYFKSESTIADLSASLSASVPTVTKAINELVAENIVADAGKIINATGRRPSLYALVPSAGYILGVVVRRSTISLGVKNMKDEIVAHSLKINFSLKETEDSVLELVEVIKKFLAVHRIDKSLIVTSCFTISGRVDTKKGLGPTPWFNEGEPFATKLEKLLGIAVVIENDTRGLAWGEYSSGAFASDENVIFVNYSWGVSIAIIIEGQLYYGSSGFSGEFGHSPFFRNDIQCYCGKEGCLETEVSGWALVRDYNEIIKAGKQTILNSANEVLDYKAILDQASKYEDSHSLNLITAQCETMGRYLGVLLNLLNPSKLIIGGEFANLGDLVLLPIQASLRKNTVSMVHKDVDIVLTKLGERAGIIGATAIAKEELLRRLS